MAEQAAASTEEEVSKRQESRGKHILVVDDEQAVRSSLSKVLQNTYSGYRIDTAASAEEALAYVERYPVDLLITDLKLPQMDGLSLTQKSHDVSPKTKSILMTAYGTNSVHCNAFEQGCVAYFEKPFDIDSLLLSVDASLETTASSAHDSLSQLLRSAAIRGCDLSISISQGISHGTLFLREGQIHYAEFDGLNGLGALVAMMACRQPQLVVSNGAPRISQPDLPVSWQAILEADQFPSVAQQFRVLRENASELSKSTTSLPKEDLSQALRSVIAEFREKHRSDDDLDIEVPSTGSILVQQTLNAEYQQRQVRLRQLVNSGVEHFRGREFEKAKRCWLAALRLDENCEQAKRNIAVVRKLIKKSPFH